MSPSDYPVTYRLLCLKDGIVMKLRRNGEHWDEELVMTNTEAQLLGESLLEAVRDRNPASDAIGAAAAQPAEPKRSCKGFQWIGQSFASCDRCGLPYWEHSHDERLKDGAGPFTAAAFELVPISAESAAACKAKWGPR